LYTELKISAFEPTMKEHHKLKKKEKAARPPNRLGFTQRIVLWSAVLIILGLTVLIIVELAGRRAPIEIPESAPTRVEMSAADWVKGNNEAKVSLLEYSDFECPSCGHYYPVLKRLFDEFGDRVKFAYRHFPLDQHAHAEPAARAAEAAGRQGRFWEMHDLIFEGRESWSKQTNTEETFIGYAKQIGLDPEQFRADLNSAEVRKAVQEDRISGQRAGIQGTPTFFLNGWPIESPQGYDAFRNVLQQAVQSAP
jgi:protein-disulfide isomerase